MTLNFTGTQRCKTHVVGGVDHSPTWG